MGSWNRPTLSWSLQCEAEGKSRLIGYDAAHTDIGMYEKSRSFDKLGQWMIIMYVLAIIGHVYALFKQNSEGFLGSFAAANAIYLIIAPIAGVRIKKEMEFNRENVTLLSEFLVSF